MVPRLVILLLLLPEAAFAEDLNAAAGKALFERTWVPAPSSTRANGGLGPLYDAPSCASCHQTGYIAPDEDTVAPGTVIRIGNAEGSADPVYGIQLQTRAVAGHVPETLPDIQWVQNGTLREPHIELHRLGYGALAPGTAAALRRAPDLAGAAALAAIPESVILERADPLDADGDGISGKASRPGGRLGRFGWKATQPDLASQIAAAFALDMGLSTPARPEPWGDCTGAQSACRAGPHGGSANDPEVPGDLRDAIVAYLANLPRRPARAGTAQGARLFAQAGCAACHAVLRDGDGNAVPAYTDLLLHDMGPGLNDSIAEGTAEAGEWRTAPLWGVRARASGGLLHDGRARSVAEAVLWHDGEAARARARYEALDAAERAALLSFVEGL